jgi:hypothetical protein
VHREHDADGEPSGDDKRRRTVAELIELADDLTPLVGRTEGLDDGAAAEGSERARELEQP